MGYKFRRIGGTEDDLWLWFRLDDTGFEAELKLLDADELQAAVREYRIAEPDGDSDGFRRWVASKAFRNFRGALDARGRPVANTLENRVAILRDPRVAAWVSERLADFGAWAEEGKDDSGSG